MSDLVYPILLLPLCAALLIAVGVLSGRLRQLQGEGFTAHCAKSAIYVSALLALLLPLDAGVQQTAAGTWLESGAYTLGYSFLTGGIHSWLCVTFALVFVVVFRFAAQYMHTEAGFHRFYFFLCLFAFAMYLLVLSGDAVLSFVAWEIAGIGSWFLIAYTFRRQSVAANATRVFIIQRAGDAAFLIGLVLLLLWTGTTGWARLPEIAASLSPAQATLLAGSFALAAFVKSAQFPFTPWLFRAMEGPTPSSAVFYGSVMVHAGVFLTILLEPVFERSGAAMWLLLAVGLCTAVYGYLVGKSQTDIKTSLGCATAAQVGLMFAACGLGWWDLAFYHLCAHAVVRCYLFLRSPSILHNAHNLPLRPEHAPARWLQMASLQQLWLDPLLDWSVNRPVKRLAQDIAWFDAHVLDPVLGTPAPVVRKVAALLQENERKMGARLDNPHDSFAHGSGLAGKLTEIVAAFSNWIEERFILQGVGRDMISLGRRLGHAANRFELLLLRPRYLVLFVLVVLLLAL